MKAGLAVVILVSMIWLVTKCDSSNPSDAETVTAAPFTASESIGAAIDVESVLEVVGLEETQGYNQSVEGYNLVAEQYNKAVQESSVTNIDGFPPSIDFLQTVSEDPEDIATSIDNGNGVEGMEAVTEEHNPDGLLGQEGGYQACVYFTITQIENQSPSQSIVTLGTDGGGAIDIGTNPSTL